MSENIKTVADERQQETAVDSGGVSNVFDTSAGEKLQGSEYVGSFDELLKSLGITPIGQMKAEDIPVTEKQEEKTVVVNSQQKYVPFNSDTYLENAEKNAKTATQNKKFMKNFRVLSKRTNDKTLLEAVPTGKSKGNVADRVKLADGEDIFEAVEKAESRKNKGVFTAESKSADSMIDKANKKKKGELLMKAKELAGVLVKKINIQKIQLIALGIIAALCVVISFLPTFNTPESPLKVLFDNGGRVFALINIACLLLAAGVSYDRIWSAIKNIKNRKADSGTGLLILFVLVLVHSLSLMFLSAADSADIHLYTLYAVFAFIVAVLSENLKAKTALRNISVVVKSAGLESIHVVENKVDSAVLAKGVAKQGREKVLYCAQADSIKGLNGDLGKRTGEDKFYGFLHIGVLIAGIIAGVVIMVRSKDTTMFVTAIVACMCLCGPTMCEVARSALLFRENLKLNKAGAAVTAYDGLKTMEKASAIAMDASDIFTAKVSNFRAVKGSRLTSHDSAVLAAATLKDTGSLLSHCFDSFEETLDGELPLAEEVEYIYRRGYSAVVAGRHVLVGNRNMLIKNDIDAPSKEEERRYAGNKCAMYVVSDGVITATFMVSYDVIPSLRKAAVGFNKTGIVLLLTSKDPSLTESLVSLKMGADLSSVKILAPDAGELMDEYRLNRSMRHSNSLVASPRKKSLFALAVSARKLCEGDKFVLLMHVAGQCLAFMMLLLAVILNVPAFFNPFVIIFIQLIWSALSVLVVSGK